MKTLCVRLSSAIGIGQTKHGFTFGKLLAVENGILGRSAYLAEIIEARLEKNILTLESVRHRLAAFVTGNDYFSDIHRQFR